MAGHDMPRTSGRTSSIPPSMRNFAVERKEYEQPPIASKVCPSRRTETSLMVNYVLVVDPEYAAGPMQYTALNRVM